MTQPVDLYRLLRWEADVPLTDAQRTALAASAEQAMLPLGEASAAFDAEGDAMLIRLHHTAFPAAVQRDMVLWLCTRYLMETASVAMEQEGTMFIGPEYTGDCPPDTLQESTDWWSSVSPMPISQARSHRTRLQTIVKRRQFTALGGYVSRELRTALESGLMCYAFVPMIIEAIWSQHADLSLRDLTAALNLSDMTRRPKEALLSWLNALPALLRQSPAAATAAPIERVIAGIQADCSLPYSQQNLSRSLGLTPAYFCRLFHEKTGQHFSTFLTRTRMEKAQALLSDGKIHNINEVAAACGYPNKSYFSQVFKKFTGLTPGEFEQRNQ